MENRKSILFFMNGFGLEAPHSLNVYTASLMPAMDKLSNYFPFTGLFAAGKEVGLNKNQVSAFKSGYLAFSSMGKPNKKQDVVGKAIENGSFDSNPVITSIVAHAMKNQSRVHILYSIGDRCDDIEFHQLKHFGELCSKNGVKDICVHVFLGNNSIPEAKISSQWLNNLKYQTVNLVPGMRIVSVAGRKFLTDAKKDEKIAYYRMVVSGVGEIWTNYSEMMDKKYQGKEHDDNMTPFLTSRENILRANDAVISFNYDNSVGGEYLDIIGHPDEFITSGKVPSNVLSGSLFEIDDYGQIPFAFQGDLPDHYFFENFPQDKRVLILADRDRIQYISSCLNGFREEFNPNINVWPIDDKSKRFELMAQYLVAFINQNTYDLIIADCELYNEQKEPATVEQLRKNMALADRVLNVAYTYGVDQAGYSLYVSSLYGVKAKLLLTKTYENIDMSLKVPFVAIGKDISKATYSLLVDGNYTLINPLIRYNMGMDVDVTLLKRKVSQKKKNRLSLLLILVVLGILGVLIFVYLKTMGYI